MKTKRMIASHLDAHEVLLAVLLDVEPEDVVRVVVHAPAEAGDGVAGSLLVPRDDDPRLHRLPVLREPRPALPVGDGGPVQRLFGRLLHGGALLLADEALHDVDAGGGALVLDVHHVLGPLVVPRGGVDVVGRVEGRVQARVVLQLLGDPRPDRGLEGDLLVETLQGPRHPSLHALDQVVQQRLGRVFGAPRAGSVVARRFRVAGVGEHLAGPPLGVGPALLQQVAGGPLRLDPAVDKVYAKVLGDVDHLLVVGADLERRGAALPVVGLALAVDGGNFAGHELVPDPRAATLRVR
jgi:hypothetical protein